MAKVKRRAHPQRKFTLERGDKTPSELRKERQRLARDQKYTERKTKWDAWDAQFTSPDYKEKWMTNPLPLCPECDEPKDTIKVRIHPFIWEIHGREEFLESCVDCYNMWKAEI